MSVGPEPERVAVGGLPALGPRVLGLLALFVRLAIGLCLLNIGLATVMASAASTFGGGPGMGGQSTLPGLEMLVTLLPYLTLAIGVGLVFGIFTTVSALLACGLVLLLPLMITYQLVIAAGMPNAGFSPYNMMARFGGPGEGIVLLFVSVFATPSFVALVLLSSPSINRYSFDALMFGRSASPVLPPAEPPRRPEETSDITIRDVSAPG